MKAIRSTKGASVGTVPNGSQGPGENGVRLGPLVDMIGFNLRLAQSASFRAFARSVGRRGVKVGHFAALTLIHRNPGISPIVLGRAIARDKSTVTPLIQHMEKRGLIRRQQSRTDRRSVTLTLTAAGESMRRDLMVRAAAHDRRLDEIIGARKAEFLALLRRISDGLGREE